ncbi:hypothetical protein Tco_1170129, partial [Tanacetum coccineum]
YLQLEDAEGVDCLPNATIFEELTLMGYEQPGGSTEHVADEAINKEMDDSLVRAATTSSSLEAEQDNGNIIKTQSKTTPNEAGSQGTTSGVNTPRSDEDKHKDCSSLGDYKFEIESQEVREERRLKHSQAQRLYKVGRSARVISSNEVSSGDQEDASKQGRKIDDIDNDAKITLVDETQGRYGDDLIFDTGVLDAEEVFTGQDMAEKEVNVAEKEVSTTDPVTTAGEVVTTASVEISTAKPTKTTITDDLTLAQTLIEIRSAKPKDKGVVIGEQSESITRTRTQQLPSKDKGKAIMEEPEKPTKRKDQIRHDEEDNVQAMIDADYQMAQQMQAKEQEKLSIEEKSKFFVQLLEARKKHFAAMRAQEKMNKSPTKAQKRNTMSTYVKNMAGYNHNQLKTKSFHDIQKLFDKAMIRVNTFVDIVDKI